MTNVVERVLLASVVLLVALPALPASLNDNNAEVKYVIMMVPDGMGLANVTATRVRLNGHAGAPLYLETLERIGYQRTYSETNLITDSSAAASAFACGEKFVNNEVCMHASGAPNNLSLLELAKRAGMSTGLVATQTITHATPAAFASHTTNRNCENEIAKQYVTESRPDVLLGGGIDTFDTTVVASPPCGDRADYISVARASGYTYVQNKAEMDAAVSGGATRLLGLFARKNLRPEYLRAPGTTEPRLPEMTAAALAVLGKNKAGFFLMVEGSLIDSANHAENHEYQFGEMVAFDQSVKAVLDWINASGERQNHTLLIVIPDHETGGFALRGVGRKAGEVPGAGFAIDTTAGWAFTLTSGHPDDFEAHHTGGDVVLWSQGPGSAPLGRAIDNTQVYVAVKNAMRAR